MNRCNGCGALGRVSTGQRCLCGGVYATIPSRARVACALVIACALGYALSVLVHLAAWECFS